MALLFMDGFDHYATADITAKWSGIIAGVPAIVGAAGRNGGSCLRAPQSMYRSFITTDSTNTIIYGFAFKRTGTGTPTIAQIQDNSGVTFCSLSLDASFHYVLSATGIGTLATTTVTAPLNTYVYFELKVVLGTTGSWVMRVNNTIVSSGTGNTKGNTATFPAAIFNFGAVTNGDFDDLYVLDASGTRNNDFLGDSSVQSLIAQTDAVAAGTNHGLTRSTGSDNGALVDDATPNGDTDYVEGSTVGLKDTFNFPSPGSSGSVKAIQVLAYAKKTDQNVKTVCPVIRSGGADYAGTTQILSTDYVYLRQIYETDPATGVSWTGSGIAAVEAGIQIVS